MHRHAGPAFCFGVLMLASFGAARGEALSTTVPAPQSMIQDPVSARANYLEQCAGCHGMNGSTAPAQLPELRGRVGWFMCTPAARAYLLRLPNIAQSRIKDNRDLADLMNFVVFVLGEDSAPPGTKPFTEAEVAHERQFALTTTALTPERARHADAAIRKCHAPASLRLLYPAQSRR
jgi:hypothetical protein